MCGAGLHALSRKWRTVDKDSCCCRTSRLPPERACIAIFSSASADMRTLRQQQQQQVQGRAVHVSETGVLKLTVGPDQAPFKLLRC
jgi:hypothetical protein